MPNGENEGKACDAVVRVLETQTGKLRDAVSCPERTGIGPPVELMFTLGSQRYAIEHTLIEAFPGQIRAEERFGQFIEPIVAELSGNLPTPGVYHVYFPIQVNIGVPPDQMDTVRADFCAWVREHAQRLHKEEPLRKERNECPRGIIQNHEGTPPGLSFDVILRREVHWASSGRHDGVLIPSRIIFGDVEAKRAERIATAFARKAPKLQRCKVDGARTVLVLEDRDIALSNHILTSEQLANSAASGFPEPDEVFLVETSLESWTVRRMKINGIWEPEHTWTEFNSAHLDDITRA